MTPAQQLQRMLMIERKVRPRYEAELKRAGQAAAAAFISSGIGGALSVIAKHETNIRRILETNMLGAAIQAGVDAMLSLEKSFAKDVIETKSRGRTPEEIVGTAARRYASKWSAQRADEISSTTSKKVTAVIQKGIANNDTPQGIASEIVRSSGGLIARSRAVMIAQTETHSAWNAGSLETAVETDLPLLKVWDATNDDRTREDHSAADGESVTLDGSFDVGGESLNFPGDPSGSPENIINCRCTMIYRPSEE